MQNGVKEKNEYSYNGTLHLPAKFAGNLDSHVLHRISVMKYFLFFALLVSGNVPASDVIQKITTIAAKQGHCSKENPCLIKVHEQDNGYSVFVRRSAIITDYGVLMFTTSALWVSFDQDGKFIRSKPTP